MERETKDNSQAMFLLHAAATVAFWLFVGVIVYALAWESNIDFGKMLATLSSVAAALCGGFGWFAKAMAEV